MAKQLSDVDFPALRNTCFRKRPLRENLQFSVTSDMLAVLEKIDDAKTMGQIQSEVRLSPNRLLSSISKLLAAGLIAVADGTPTNGRYLGTESFLKPLKENLFHSAGPMAEIILGDVLARMGLETGRIPAGLAAELILNLSNEIVDSELRAEFKAAMIQVLRRTEALHKKRP